MRYYPYKTVVKHEVFFKIEASTEEALDRALKELNQEFPFENTILTSDGVYKIKRKVVQKVLQVEVKD